MPKEKKKKTYLVCCEVNMCAELIVPMYIIATNETIAMNKAVEKCKAKGCYFHVKAVSCKLAAKEENTIGN